MLDRYCSRISLTASPLPPPTESPPVLHSPKLPPNPPDETGHSPRDPLESSPRDAPFSMTAPPVDAPARARTSQTGSPPAHPTASWALDRIPHSSAAAPPTQNKSSSAPLLPHASRPGAPATSPAPG